MNIIRTLHMTSTTKNTLPTKSIRMAQNAINVVQIIFGDTREIWVSL